MVIQSNIEAYGNIGYVYVTGITIKIAVRDTKRKLALPNRRTVVYCKKSGWPTFRTTCAY
jgi:hypothetical protein